MTDSRRSLAPGLLLTLTIATAATYLHQVPFPPFTVGAAGKHPIDGFLIAILIGVSIRNLMTLPSRAHAGIKYSVHKVLPFAIVFMGAKLDFYDVLRISSQSLLISVTCVVLALALTVWLCQQVGVARNLGLLIGSTLR